jgi:putative transposase
MIDLVEQRQGDPPLNKACDVLGVARATVYRRRNPKPSKACNGRSASPRRLSDDERCKVLETLHSQAYQDQPVGQVYAELLEKGVYLASVRTMYRILESKGESKERRNQRAPRSFAVPRLAASRPNEIWTWDISKLATYQAGVFLNLYVILDLFSRYVVAWMVAERENSALAKQLFAETISRSGIEPGSLSVHSDRGAPMTAIGFVELLAELGVDKSLSRPRVSNDNAFSEAHFKTLKYQPDYPGRFASIAHARLWMADFFDWYNNRHRHSGLARFTPADVYFGRVEDLAARRQQALDKAFDAKPNRFVKGRPVVPLPPAVVAINPLMEEENIIKAEAFIASMEDSNDASKLLKPETKTPEVNLPGLPVIAASGKEQAVEVGI